MNHRVVYSWCLTAFIAGLLFAVWKLSGNTEDFFEVRGGIAYRKIEIPKEIARLNSYKGKHGARETLAFLKDAYRDSDPVAVHDLLHRVGEMLYEELGVTGIDFCDETYNWGCYHGFLGRVFAGSGKASLSEIASRCEAKVLPHSNQLNGCFHGIGHGLLTLEGSYSIPGLKAALADCDGLSGNSATTACYNGVFMEYNMRTMEPGDTYGKLRPYDPKDPHAPCQLLALKHQPDCYYEQTDWWRMKLGADFGAIGELCAQVPDRDVRFTCFRGIGRGAWGESKFRQEKAFETCNLMPSPEGILGCTEVIVEELVVLQNNRAGAEDLCSRLDTTSAAECHAHLTDFLCSALVECPK